MNKLLNRFAWLIAISAGIGIGTLFGYGFEKYLISIVFIFIIKFLFLSENFIEERIVFFANGLKNNYIEKSGQIQRSAPTKNVGVNLSVHPADKKEIINLSEIKDEKIKEKVEYIEKKSKPTVFEKGINKILSFIKDFFSTNIIAKIGAIILFFVLLPYVIGTFGGIWEVVGPVGRLILGFIVSGIIFGFGIKLDNKGNKGESLILIGLSILLNYGIILAGRYLIGESISGVDGFLTEGVTFFLLILNTIFGIVTSLIYNSRTLLIFSFLFAYINPFIIGADSSGTPYTLIGYSFIVSLGALFLSKRNSSFTLLFISFVFGNLLFLAAPYTSDIDWSSKIIFTTILSVIAIFLSKKTEHYGKSTIFLFIGTYIFLIFNLVIFSGNLSSELLFSNKIIFETIFVISIILLIFSYIFSNKKNLVHLFYIGTFGTIALISPIIFLENNLMNYSIILIIIFSIFNILLPFINNRLLKKENFYSLISGSLAGVLFIAFQIYSFGELYFPGTVEGLAFGGLAITYFLQSYFIIQKIGIEKMQEDEDLKNIFYTFAGISISLFSIAVAFVFSDYPEIITTTWLFEATILYYFYSKNNSNKIFIASTLLFIVGLTKFGILLDHVQSEDYKFLISFIVILSSFILNLFFINKNNKNIIGKNIHSILHLIGMGIMGGLLLQIIPSSGHGWSMLGISLFITILGSFYAKLNIKFLKIAFVVLLTLFAILHIGEIDSIFWKLEKDEKSYLEILQYIVSAIFISNIFIWKKMNKKIKLNKVILIILSIYAFIISNVYVLENFKELLGSFSLTIYWGLVASILLFYGINKNIIKYRTIGLYFLSITTLKVFFIDIWVGLDGDSRFLALGILGVSFIVISTLYTRKYGNNILGDFSFNNLKSKEEDKKKSPIIPFNKGDEDINSIDEKKIEENPFMEKLSKVDVSNIKVVRFFPNNGENFTVRAKNIQRLTMLITKKFGKTNFKAGELEDTYNYIMKNYKTKLSRREHDKIRTTVKDFIDKGGEVEIVKKSD